MNSNPLISVIVPVFNQESYLRQCLDSLINQTFENIEIICINDGSTDQSGVILRKYMMLDDRVTVLELPNEGVSAARNSGLQQAKGAFILFVDSDDWIEPTTCEIAFNSINKYEADIVMWPYIRENGKKGLPKKIFDEDIVFEGDNLKKTIHRRFIGPIGNEVYTPENMDSLCTVWGKLYRTEITKGLQFVDLKKIGSFEDGLFNLQVFGNINRAVYINQYLYHYRTNNYKSATRRYNPDLPEQRNTLYFLMSTYISENNLDQDYTEGLSNRKCLDVLGLGINAVAAEKGIISKREGIYRILNDQQRKECLQVFNTTGFPVYWKLFYNAAKKDKLYTLLVLLTFIQLIRRK